MVSKSGCFLAMGFMAIATTWVSNNACLAQESKGGDWDVSVDARQDAHENWHLHMKMKFVGTKARDIDRFELPGRCPDVPQIVAIEANSNWPMKATFPESHAPPRQIIRVEPGQVLEGDVQLGNRLPSLNAALKGTPVIVFWTFKYPGSRRVGGWVEIPQTKSQSKGDSAASKDQQNRED